MFFLLFVLRIESLVTFPGFVGICVPDINLFVEFVQVVSVPSGHYDKSGKVKEGCDEREREGKPDKTVSKGGGAIDGSHEDDSLEYEVVVG